jgi:hypothetical protein
LFAGVTVRATIALVGLAAVAALNVGEAQPCGPAGVLYIVRGEDGAVLDQRELDAVYEQSTEPVGVDIGVFPDAVSRIADGSYWPPATEGTRTPVLHFRANVRECSLRLVEVTLVHHGERMRLIFDVELPFAYGDIDLFSGYRSRVASVVVDSPPFSGGTFRLDENRLAEFKWSAKVRSGYPIPYPMIPAELWVAEPDAGRSPLQRSWK